MFCIILKNFNKLSNILEVLLISIFYKDVASYLLDTWLKKSSN